MTVNEIAQQLKITVDTVRYYTRNGFLQPKKNPSNGYKIYTKEDSERLRFIVNARQLGFSVKDIEQILQHASSEDSACPLVRKLIEERLQQTEEKFQQLKLLRNNMKKAINQWQKLPNQTSSNKIICHLIDSFTSQIDKNEKVNQQKVTK